MASHRKRHTAAQYKCNQCDKAYRDKQNLTKHLETHTGSIEKRFVCDFCGMGFRRNTELKVDYTVSVIYLLLLAIRLK